MDNNEFLKLAATSLGAYIEEDFRRTGEWDEGSIMVVNRLIEISNES